MSSRRPSAYEQAKLNEHAREVSESKDLWGEALKNMVTIIWATQLPAIFARKEEVTFISLNHQNMTMLISGCKRRDEMLSSPNPIVNFIADKGLFRYRPREDHTTLIFSIKIGNIAFFTFFENIPHISTTPKPEVKEMFTLAEHNC